MAKGVFTVFVQYKPIVIILWRSYKMNLQVITFYKLRLPKTEIGEPCTIKIALGLTFCKNEKDGLIKQ